MKKIITLLVGLVCTLFVSAQDFTLNHQLHLESLGNAKDSLYQIILSRYNQHIQSHPLDAQAQMERCKFMKGAFYDEYEDYDPNYEQSEECVQQLIDKFPDDPNVLLYGTEYLYGDSLERYLLHLENLTVQHQDLWRDYKWDVYEQLAQQYYYNKNYLEVINYGERAIFLNDTLDLSLWLGEAYKETNRKKEGVEILIKHLDSTNTAWVLNQKGKLLLSMNEPVKAMKAFRMAAIKDTTYEDSGSLAKAMIENGLVAEAREYLRKEYREGMWNADGKLHNLLEYDLTYGNADSARLTYRRLVEANSYNDPVGIYRLRLFAKSPLMGWTLGDVCRVLLLALLLVSLLVAPYLWVLPIHFLGRHFQWRGYVKDEATFTWRLRHFWTISALWLICDVLAMVLFNYKGLVSMLHESVSFEEEPLVSIQVANYTLFFMLGCTVFTGALLNRDVIVKAWHTVQLNYRSIWVGIGLAFALRFGMGIYYAILKAFDITLTDTGSSGIADIKHAIMSINEFYSPALGFLFVVILVPIYEEILFRGVFLSACQRNLTFWGANILQAIVFALAHDDLMLLPFYIAFGIVAGVYTRNTQSLLTGVSMHMTNNLLAFLVLLVRGV